MKVAVTGGSGRLGRHVLAELAQYGHESIDCDLMPPEGPYRFFRTDILQPGDLTWAFSGVDVVLHLAAIPNPFRDPPERVFGINVAGTYNVLEAALRTGVRRVVIASSDSALGFTFRSSDRVPDYLPFDEDHPKYPEDPYCLSKAFAEDLALAFTRRSGLQTICLRPCWIWFPDRDEGYRAAVNDPSGHWKGLWVYVDVRDAARSFRLAAEAPRLPAHAVCYVAAADLAAREETLALIDRFYPGVPRVDRTRLEGHRSVIDGSRAEQLLGYRPQHSWRDWLK
ncbi:MAG: NAD(P)-dependent oxidoreductase [Anaerolineae bacterium]|nr:NAD(P)-dependent oxidoreductase [Anaerolineae bacterium]